MSTPLDPTPPNDLVRLRRVVAICRERGWNQTRQHAQQQLFLLYTGQIKRAFK